MNRRTLTRQQAKQEALRKIRSNTPLTLKDYIATTLLKYVIVVGILGPIAYFGFHYRNDEPFWLYSIYWIILIHVLDLGEWLWRKWKSRQR